MFRINKLQIQKLSGPVSFVYLYPKKEEMIRKALENGTFLPIIILLGDVHFSEMDRCEPCEEKSGCYMTESKTFLSAIDSIADKYPVDFYMEYSHRRAEVAVKEEGVLNKLLSKTIGCYKRWLRSDSSYDCDFSNIRWHYADSRVFSKYIENITEAVFYYTSYMRSQETKPFNGSSFSSYVGMTEGYEIFNSFLDTLKTSIEEDTTLEELSIRLSFLVNGVILDNPMSLINKQLKKSKLGIDPSMYSFFSLSTIGIASETKVIEYFRLDQLSKDPKDVISMICDYLMNGKEFTFDKELRDYYLNVIEDLWLKFTMCFMDLYFIGRMLKTPKNNINSYLSLGFFGKSHIDTIGRFLTYIEPLYELRYLTESGNKRCVEMTEDVDFNEDLREYSTLRQKLEDITPYYTIQKNERLSREVD